jgi:hypothetical protein
MDLNGMAAHLTRSDCARSNVEDKTNGMLWNNSEEAGDARSECEEMMALTVKMEKIEKVTLTGKGK